MQCLRDALDTLGGIVKLINYSPKCRHLFSEKILENDGPNGGINLSIPLVDCVD